MLDGQVLYQGRWVSREHFRAFVYSKNEKKLANSYEEFSNLISTGLWQSEPLKEIEQNLNKNEIEKHDNIVEIKPKRGRKCRSQRNQ